MGFRNLDEIIGRSDLLERNHELDHWKTKNLDLSGMLRLPAEAATNEIHCIEKQENKIGNVLDQELIAESEKAISDKAAGSISSEPLRIPTGQQGRCFQERLLPGMAHRIT